VNETPWIIVKRKAGLAQQLQVRW